MAQNTNVVLPDITYSRTDYTAMRAYAQKISIQSIAERYYSEDSPQLEHGLERYLIDMRDHLIERAIENNPHLAEILKGARQGGSLTVKALDILAKAADAPKPIPQLSDRLSLWFRPKTVVAFRNEEIYTLQDLVSIITRRGTGWWRSIPRIGELRAQVIVNWINKNSNTLGEVVVIEPSTKDIIQLVLDTSRADQLIPIERLILPVEIDGHNGINRGYSFCYIQAKNDRDALVFYLNKFIDKPHTFRAYRKELERFLLWSVIVQKKPISSLLVDDCEEYKDFLADPLPSFRGKNLPRQSSRWKPFMEKTCLSPRSQKQALLIIRTWFKYLVDVRYLAGNPWAAVSDPSVTKEVDDIRVDRALSESLWDKVIDHLHSRAQKPENSQDRIALAALLLMGDSGLRRHEAAKAKRSKLKLHDEENMIFVMEVNGKGNKNRKVPVSERTVLALREHWKDHGLDFEKYQDDTPLLSPLIIPQTEAAKKKHFTDKRKEYSGTALYEVVMQTWRSVYNQKHLSQHFSEEEIRILKSASPHAYRHTFGTLSVEADMPLDVVQ